jgi:hypothetical protein
VPRSSAASRNAASDDVAHVLGVPRSHSCERLLLNALAAGSRCDTRQSGRSQECERGTQECVRHVAKSRNAESSIDLGAELIVVHNLKKGVLLRRSEKPGSAELVRPHHDDIALEASLCGRALKRRVRRRLRSALHERHHHLHVLKVQMRNFNMILHWEKRPIMTS